MTLTIELTPEQSERLETAARSKGVDPTVFAQQLVAEHLPLTPVHEDEDPTLALFARWEQEDREKPPEEVAAEDRLWEEFEKGINETRQAQGMRQL